MDYVSASSHGDEQIILTAKLSWLVAFLPAAVICAVSGISALVAAYVIYLNTTDGTSSLGRAFGELALIAILPFLFVFFSSLLKIITYYTTEIAITDRRFIHKTGLISRQVNEVSVKRIEGATLKQGIIGRVLNFGTIIVRGTGTDHVVVRRVDTPLQLQRAVNDANHRFG